MTLMDHLPPELEAAAAHVRAANRAFGAADNKLNWLLAKATRHECDAAVREAASRYAEAVVEAEMEDALGNRHWSVGSEIERLKGALQTAKFEQETLEPLITAYMQERSRRHRDLIDAVDRFDATCAKHERVFGTAAAEFAASRSIKLDGDQAQLLAIKLAIAADISLEVADDILANAQPLAEAKAA